ncbi:MAG: 5,6-dimethylbenzimidazole synthase [Acidimicrobiales bacterium]
MESVWPRPIPTIGDRTSASDRSSDPSGWAFPDRERAALAGVIAARRDIRRFRPDLVPEALLLEVIHAAHQAPSVGHSQPWRYVIVRDPLTRVRAASLADSARIAQAAGLDPDSRRQLLDLDLEGIREAPVGLVVCCDRRVPPAGVLGRATFADADMWSCAASIQNLWLTARAHGLGVGWVTLFEPRDLLELVHAPPGVETLGWLCIGWPDERPPLPGLERRGWSKRQPLEEVLLSERWPAPGGEVTPPAEPRSRLAANGNAGVGALAAVPEQRAVVAAHDLADVVLSPPGSLGLLDRAVDKVLAVRPGGLSPDGGVLVIAAADHPVAAFGVSAYDPSVTRTVAEATAAGASLGAVAAASSGLVTVLVDAGVDGSEKAGSLGAAGRTGSGSRSLPAALAARPDDPKGDLVNSDALSPRDAGALVDAGESLARRLCEEGRDLVAVGEVGVANTTVAAALASALTGARPDQLVGLGASSDSAMLQAKTDAVVKALGRVRRGLALPGGSEAGSAIAAEPLGLLAALGGGEIAVLAGVVLGAARGGAVVVLDGLATSVAALLAVRIDPAVSAYLLAGQMSREKGHSVVLEALGLEPLLDLRMRCGEGVGASLASSLLRSALEVRLSSARTA